MRYTLAVLSHGDPSPYRDRALAAFREHVTPEPAAVVSYHDGPPSGKQLGFCRATRRLWQLAVDAGEPFVFWLEHDFLVKRRVEVAALGAILRDHRLVQVSLMRQPVNSQEKRRGRVLGDGDDGVTTELLLGGDGYAGSVWLRHSRYFTTNPSLMRTEFMRDRPFAAGASRLPHDIECEGRYGVELIRQGFQFAVMGAGEPWVEHIGVRDGEGY